MRARSFRALPFAAAGLLILLALFGYVELQFRRESHATLAEARASAPGWFPGFLPASATAIEAVHIPDLNTSSGRVTFDARDDAGLRRELGLLAVGSALCGSLRRNPEGWPDLLVGERVDPVAARAAGLELFVFRERRPDTQSESRQFGVAVDWKARTLMYWTLSCDIAGSPADG